MKASQILSLIVLCFCFSCSSENEPALEPECLVNLMGDKDGFGLGISDGGILSIPAGTALPINNFGIGDAWGTDFYPATLSTPTQDKVEIIHINFPEFKTISRVTLTMNTIGIQDGDIQVQNSDTDLKLFLDGIEIPNAFDNVDQFDFINGQWSSFSSKVVIVIPENAFPVFYDGLVVLTIEVHQLNPNSGSLDAFAIDYSEFEICK